MFVEMKYALKFIMKTYIFDFCLFVVPHQNIVTYSPYKHPLNPVYQKKLIFVYIMDNSTKKPGLVNRSN